MASDGKFAEGYARSLGEMVYGEKPEYASAFEKVQKIAERIRNA
ncbi:hypothetical protein RGCCGE502_33836 (plasmid) [Rhizobium grahamii CCGE 502]|uniref:Uncharacterized protein n=1 Tax=Rhizobium grahamii CCGE 502 TaxID=990285 RepID=S3H6J4_9HYPH|nr:hypothetical protein RGCCGE502_33836 [Rhizobium grahamii CCGE 502]